MSVRSYRLVVICTSLLCKYHAIVLDYCLVQNIKQCIAQTLHSGVISITQVEEIVIQEFSTSNITVLPPSRFSTSQDIDNISVRKKIHIVHYNQRNFLSIG